MLKKFARGFSIAGGILFLVAATNIIYKVLFGYSVFALDAFLLFFGYIITSIALFWGHKNVLFPIGTCLIAIGYLSDLPYLLSYIFSGITFWETIFTFIDFLMRLGMIYIFVIALFTHIPKLSEKTIIIKKLCFISVILISIIKIRYLFTLIQFIVKDPYYFRSLFFITNLLSIIPEILAFACLALWMVNDYKAPKTDEYDEYTQTNDFSKAGFNLAGHILLLCLFGIWQYFWVYRTTKHLNADKTEEYRSPVKKLLLYIFIPFYSIYWVYMSCQRIDNLAKQRGLTTSISTLCVIFSIFMPFVSWIVMQNRINKICKLRPVENIANRSNATADLERLREYKSLLDEGVITQEEFDRKKQEIIN